MDVLRRGDGSNGRPPPFFIEPSSGVHTHSLILLHGLGSNGEIFGRELLETGICSNGMTLPEVLPGSPPRGEIHLPDIQAAAVEGFQTRDANAMVRYRVFRRPFSS